MAVNVVIPRPSERAARRPRTRSAWRAASGWIAGLALVAMALALAIAGSHLALVPALAISLGLVLLWRVMRRALAASRAGVLALQTALAELKRSEEETRRLAYHDAVTGLPNRLLFGDRLRVALTQARRQGTQAAMLFVDLDRFKLVNDSLGHAFGDRVLQRIAERLLACVRAGDTVARFGGDEFMLLLPVIDGAPGAARVAQKVLETLREPLALDGRKFWVTPSIGIALFPDDADTPETLLRQADLAMYRAKERGRDTYEPSLPDLPARGADRPTLERDFRSALANDELTLHYQPIVDAASGRIRALEALPRWHHPTFGPIEPAEFVPLAEVTGLIHPMSAWVLRGACAQMAAWHRAGHYRIGVNVNLSGRQLQEPDLAARLEQALRESGLPARRLELEIAEADVMRHVDSAVEALHRVKALGVQVALDAFGVGPSSLRFLRRLPIDALKIHPSLLRELEDEDAIVRAVIALARGLKLRVVAEGVETEPQRRLLQAHGCTRLQGRLTGAPMSADGIDALLEESRSRLARGAARILGWPR